MTSASPLGLRLFLEGIEVPVISASVTIQPSTPATAAIQVVPTDGILRILPRTLVHLFYLDEAISEDDVRKARADGQEALQTRAPSSMDELNRFQVSDDSYKLLFAGEVVGLNFTKSNQNRSVVLQCMDLSSYWDTCYQWFANYSVHGNGFFDKAHIFCQAGSGLFDNITGGTSWVISQILNRPPKNKMYKDCKGLLGGMISLIEVVGGVRPDKGTYNAVRGINDFFTIAELRYNLSGMLGAVAGDTTSQRIYAGKAFRSWLMNGMTSLGNMISFRDIVRHVGKWVFHDVYPNPSAMYVGPLEYKVRVDASALPRKSEGRSLLEGARDKIEVAIQVTVDIIHGYVPPNEVARLSIKGQWDACLKPCNEAEEKINNALASDIPRKAHVQLTQAVRTLEYVILKIDVIDPSGVDPAHIKKKLESIKFILDDLLVKKSKKVTKETGHHLFSQLLLPETFFMAPPRCNVIFPDQYTEFSYNRNFMREVTRLSCGSGLGWLAGKGANSKVLARYYYAPNIKAVDGTSLHNTLRRGAKVLLPHEVHSGIIPKIEWLSEGHKWGARKGKADNREKKIHYIQKLANFQFFTHRWQARTISVAGRFNPHIVLGFPALILDRSMPPAHIMSSVVKVLGTNVLPTSYLGKVMNLTHSINQSGGNTVINMAYCRTHDALDDDFLGALQAGLTSHRKFKGENVTVTIDMEKMSKDTGYPRGKDKKRTTYIKLLTAISQSINVSKSHSGETATYDELLAMGVPSAQIAKLDTVPSENKDLVYASSADGELYSETKYYVPEGYSSSFGNVESIKDKVVQGVGKIKSVELSDSKLTLNRTDMAAIGMSSQDIEKFAIGIAKTESVATGEYVVPRKVTVTYRRYKPLKVQPEGGAFRVEEVMQPEWYDQVWQPDQIGEGVYETLLGCGAITDDNATAEGITEMYEAALGNDAKVAFGGGQGSLSIAQAVNTLGAHYSLLKQKGIGINAFIRAYTYRPVATLPQMLGSSDYDPAATPPVGTEGFHSRAFGDYNTDVVFVEGQEPKVGAKALEGLISGEHPTKNRLGDSVKEKIPAHLDPRGRAHQRVAAYMAELNLSRGLQG